MWRLWTRGWGPRDWWRWFRREGWPIWAVSRLPPRLAYWAYIRVVALSGDNPDNVTFRRATDEWRARYRLD
jgi:hypothetical protein